MNKLKEGSKWTAILGSDIFVIIQTVELDGHTWVHYRKEPSEKEYSCYAESFLERFIPLL